MPFSSWNPNTLQRLQWQQANSCVYTWGNWSGGQTVQCSCRFCQWFWRKIWPTICHEELILSSMGPECYFSAPSVFNLFNGHNNITYGGRWLRKFLFWTLVRPDTTIQFNNAAQFHTVDIGGHDPLRRIIVYNRTFITLVHVLAMQERWQGLPHFITGTNEFSKTAYKISRVRTLKLLAAEWYFAWWRFSNEGVIGCWNLLNKAT